jgi:hypothetical protein
MTLLLVYIKKKLSHHIALFYHGITNKKVCKDTIY